METFYRQDPNRVPAESLSAPVESATGIPNAALATEGLSTVNIVNEQPDGQTMGGTVVGEERLRELNEILNRYRQGKHNLDNRVIENERWWRLHNEQIEAETPEGHQKTFTSKSGWLHNVIVNKHADATEAYPEPIFLPREQADAAEAEILSKIVPIVMDANNYEEIYDLGWWRKLYSGGRITKVVWDPSKCNGLGDIAISDVPVLNFFWQPGVMDIQESQYVFQTTLLPIEIIEEMYPDTRGKIKANNSVVSKFQTDDRIDTTKDATIVECYYKRRSETGGTVVHYVKYVDDIVLEASENNPEMAGIGVYAHGLYPYDIDALYNIEGSPWGYGCIDVAKSTQIAIDRIQTATVKNAIVGATPRYAVSEGSGINEEELQDLTRDVIHATSLTGDDYLRVLETPPLSANHITMLSNMIMELRETTGNTETSAGTVPGGVTAASAIAALQEASGKGSKDMIRSAYRSYRRVVNLVVECMRQFYELPRYYRILGDNGMVHFVAWSNERIKLQQIAPVPGSTEPGWRLPVFDIDVRAAKQTAYSRMSQNELALQFFNIGMFNPQIAEQALVAMKMMSFEGKEDVIRDIQNNSLLMQQMQQLQQLAYALAVQVGDGELAQQLAAQMGGAPPMGGGAMGGGAPAEGGGEAPNLDGSKEESAVTAKARERSAAAAAVD